MTLWIMVADVVHAGPTVSIYTDGAEYIEGDTIEVSLTARNFDAAMSVDVYVGLLTWDDGLYTIGGDGWTGNIAPWVCNIYIPMPFNLNRTVFFTVPIPSEMPPIGHEGNYSLAAGLASPGQFSFVSELSFASFTIISLGIPTASIESITPNPAIRARDTVVFRGHGTDTDGSITAYEWRSDIDGVLDESDEFQMPAADLTLGTHTISFKVMDDEDHWSRAVTRELSIEDTNLPPTAYIDLVFPSPAAQGEDIVEFVGHGSDLEGPVAAYEWSSNIDGFISGESRADISASELTPGTHVISYRVMDEKDVWSETVTASLEIWAAAAEELHVNASAGSDANSGSIESPLKTITQALLMTVPATSSPVKIIVAQGTYSAETNGESLPLQMKPWVYLIGAGRDDTIISADGTATHVLSCIDSPGTRIEGLQITGGNASGQGADQNGGGIICMNSSTVVLSCVISNNAAIELAGGIYFFRTSALVSNCILTGNTASAGGAIHCDESSPTIRGNIISGNEAGNHGGAIYFYKSTASVENNWLVDNSAGTYGGAIRCNQHGSPIIKNNLIAGNSASTGGAMALSSISSPTILSCTIANNSARAHTGGIYCTSNSSPILENCILWGNDRDIYKVSGCNPVITYTDIEDGYSGEGNISNDPIFMPGALGEYYLDPSSPCINSGSKSARDAGMSELTTQASGAPDSGIIDMGYHSPIL